MTAVVGVRMPCARCDQLRILHAPTGLCGPCRTAERVSRVADHAQNERRLTAHALETVFGLVPA